MMGTPVFLSVPPAKKSLQKLTGSLKPNLKQKYQGKKRDLKTVLQNIFKADEDHPSNQSQEAPPSILEL